MTGDNEWERAVQVWDRFIASYPGHRGGVYVDSTEGPVWIWRSGKVVEVTHRDPWWSGRFHIRDAQPEQQSLELA